MGPEERIPEDWFAKQVAFADRTDGDIDTLANRIAHIRTWTFVSNRVDWLKDPPHWQERTREIEDKLSDALHECLTQRFVDLRTSALMKGMRDKDELHAEIAEDGAINVENHYVGRLRGFRFSADAGGGEGIHGKAARTAAAQVLSRELSMRARRVSAAQPDAFQLTQRGLVLWKGQEIAQLEASDDPLKPSVGVLADEHLSAPDREKVQARLEAWVTQAIAERLKPLVEIGKAEDISGLARGIAFRLRENLGILRRETIGEEIKALDQTARAQLRKYGVRFGAFNIYFPTLLKPAAAELALALWSLKNAGTCGLTPDAMPEAPRAGLTSFAPAPAAPEAFYRAYGYHVCGPRAVRIDMLERLADHIRPLLAWRSQAEGAAAPKGATGDGGFTATPDMMSLLGCSPEELGGVLKALGFRVERRPIKKTAEAPAETEVAQLAVVESDVAVVAPAAEPAPAASVATAHATETAAKPAPSEPEFEEIWRPAPAPPRRAPQGRAATIKASAPSPKPLPSLRSHHSRLSPRRPPRPRATGTTQGHRRTESLAASAARTAPSADAARTARSGRAMRIRAAPTVRIAGQGARSAVRPRFTLRLRPGVPAPMPIPPSPRLGPCVTSSPSAARRPALEPRGRGGSAGHRRNSAHRQVALVRPPHQDADARRRVRRRRQSAPQPCPHREAWTRGAHRRHAYRHAQSPRAAHQSGGARPAPGPLCRGAGAL